MKVLSYLMFKANTVSNSLISELNTVEDLEELRKQMLKFAILQLTSIEQAEDVVQEALTCAMECASTFKGKSSFKTWVFSILKFKIIDVIRMKNKITPINDFICNQQNTNFVDKYFDDQGHWDECVPCNWETPDKMAENSEFWTVFEICLNKLPAKYAQIFMLREVMDLDSEEICKKLNLSISNFNVIMYRSRIKLRECLEKSWILKDDCGC